MSLSVPGFLLKAFMPLALVALLASCTDHADSNSDRGPLGKADSVGGTCEDSCGEKSDGDCWCDEECAYYGDCCADKVALCDAPTLCGGWLGNTCEDDEYCNYPVSAMCGAADAGGVCAPRPEACTTLEMPVCGCDSQTYSNSCFAAAAGVGIGSNSACEPPMCGGFGNLPCPDGLVCVDDPSSSCNENGGVDCSGICLAPVVCEPVLCTLFCPNGFKKDNDGCDICDCMELPGPINSCEDSCGSQSESGSCWCDEACEGYGDCCGDIDEQCNQPSRVPAAGMCVKNSNDECATDDDCNIGGCGSELCFNPSESSGISTCECGGPGVPVSGCGCVAGSCTWYNE